MAEKVLGIIRFADLLFLTSDRVVVAKVLEKKPINKKIDTALKLSAASRGILITKSPSVVDYASTKEREKEYLELPLEDVLKADEKNFAIPNSEIRKVELKKHGLFGRSMKLNIITNRKTHKWLVPTSWIKKELEDYEKLLRLAFGDKLSVKK